MPIKFEKLSPGPQFVLRWGKFAMQNMGAWMNVSMAVAALESGWGRSHLARDHHNLFGITKPTKNPSPQQGNLFESYETDAESWHHFRLILDTMPCYNITRTTALHNLAEGMREPEFSKTVLSSMAPIYCPADPDWTCKTHACLDSILAILAEFHV